jgi:hypothetical protein
MKLYLIIFLTEGEFATENVMAENIASAYSAFMNRNIQHDEVYSISRAA